MKKRWRLFRPPEQEPPATQQPEAIAGADAVPEGMLHEEVVCGECGRSYTREKELGKRALKTGIQEAPKVSKRRFETAEELVHDFSTKYPEVAARIRKKFSPKWESQTWERIDKNWNLRTVNDPPQGT